jgi:putative ABC transport system permease protein
LTGLIMGQGMRLALIGIVIGLAAAYGLTRFLAGLLFNVKATDPLTFAAVAAILSAVALAAAFIPAQRATRIDPVVALRQE